MFSIILAVTDKWVPNVSHVNPDLVGSSSNYYYPAEREHIFAASEPVPTQNCVDGFGPCTLLRNAGGVVRLVPQNWSTHRVGELFHWAMHQADVLFEHLVAGEGLAQVHESHLRLSNHDRSRGVHIEAMSYTKLVFVAARKCETFVVFEFQGDVVAKMFAFATLHKVRYIPCSTDTE